MLRLLSFGMDYHWAVTKLSPGSVGHPGPHCPFTYQQQSAIPLNARQRTTISHPLDSYNPINYLAYTLYSPLYIAGPIMTFNDFYWQLRRPHKIEIDELLSYALRFVACLLTMEFILHFMYVVAIKDAKAVYGDTPMQLSMIGFWNLIVVWLKVGIFLDIERLADVPFSCCYLGGSFGYGLLQMGCIRQRT